MTAQTIGETTFATPSDREVLIERVVDAPRGLVFEALTNPEHVRHRYGRRRRAGHGRRLP
jgi:uncharacterized protein YndB with AHSA1/START domain